MTKVLSASSFKDICGKVEELPLPSDPETVVRIRHLPIGVLRRLADPATKDGEEGDKARAELIRRSVVDGEGKPIFDEAYPLADELTVELLQDLMTLIGKVNNKSAGKDLTKQVDEAEKN